MRQTQSMPRMGAHPNADGLSAIHTHMTNSLNTPVEALEYAYPLRVRRYAIRCRSGGAGQPRGGDGVIREVEVLTACASDVAVRSSPDCAVWLGGRSGGTGRRSGIDFRRQHGAGLNGGQLRNLFFGDGKILAVHPSPNIGQLFLSSDQGRTYNYFGHGVDANDGYPLGQTTGAVGNVAFIGKFAYAVTIKGIYVRKLP